MAAIAVTTAVLAPATGSAQESDAEKQRDEVKAQQAEIILDIDALQAEDAEIRQALDELETNVAGRQADLDAAQESLAQAEADVAAAQEAVAEVEERIIVLDEAADQLVVDSFVDPPTDQVLEVFRADTLSDAAVKQILLKLQSDSDADVLDMLDNAHTELAAEQREKEELASVAATMEDEATKRLDDVEAALAQQQQFAAELEDRLDAKLSEVEALKRQDAELSAKIEAEQAELAKQLRSMEPAGEGSQPSPTTAGAPSAIQPAPGGLATVTCPAGGSITVAGSIAGNVQSLLNQSSADGVSLCGGGYRDPQQQIELRKKHCGTSSYAIYEMPSSQCSPPTATPGRSNHEKGLAIDFTCNGGSSIVRGNACWNWLSAHAGSYGLYNLPSEPWHWSVNGN